MVNEIIKFTWTKDAIDEVSKFFFVQQVIFITMAKSEDNQLMVLQTSNTIRFALHYLIESLAISPNRYLFEMHPPKQCNLIQVITEDTENEIIYGILIGSEKKKIKKVKKKQRYNLRLFEVTKQNEQHILKELIDHYLDKKRNYCKKWNIMFGEMFGADFNMIDYRISTNDKLTKLCGHSFIESQVTTKYPQIVSKMNQIHQFHLLFPRVYNVQMDKLKVKKIEHYLLNCKYDESLDTLKIDSDDTNKYYPYYQDIYKIIIYQIKYEKSKDESTKKSHFMTMIKLLTDLTNYMEPCDPMTCALFGDVTLNYNPFPLTQTHIIEIKNMVFAGCCHIFTDHCLDSYDIFGSINCLFLMIQLIESKKVTANDNILRIITENIKSLFEATENKNIANQSELFKYQIKQKKEEWINKQKLIPILFLFLFWFLTEIQITST